VGGIDFLVASLDRDGSVQQRGGELVDLLDHMRLRDPGVLVHLPSALCDAIEGFTKFGTPFERKTSNRSPKDMKLPPLPPIKK
jgi:hypothetical protein